MVYGPGAVAIQAASLLPKDTHAQVKREADKLALFLQQKEELATTPINKLPLPKEQKTAFKVTVGGELNVHEGKAALRQRAVLIKRAISQGGKELTKDQKAFFGAQQAVCEFLGEIEEKIVKGNTSYSVAFKRKKVDGYIRATLTLAEKGGMDPTIAIENIELLEKFKEKLPEVSAAFAKNADKIQKLKNKASNPALAPFYAKAASVGGGNIPSDLQRQPKATDREPQLQQSI